MGRAYYFGDVAPKDYVEAKRWFDMAAEQGYAAAQARLGDIFNSGFGVPINYAQALHWYRQAADQGDKDAQGSLGIMLKYGAGVPRDLTEAAKWFGRAAAQGDPFAQNSLGVAYERGDGVEQNLPEAIDWYHKSAQQGYAEAQNNLGHVYLSSPAPTQAYPEAVKWYRRIYDLDRKLNAAQNFVEAKKWFLKAANQANSYASFNLGIMYEEGLGMPKDLGEAYRWYSLAASQWTEGQGVFRANIMRRRDSMAEKMTPDQLKDAETLPREWKSK